MWSLESALCCGWVWWMSLDLVHTRLPSKQHLDRQPFCHSSVFTGAQHTDTLRATYVGKGHICILCVDDVVMWCRYWVCCCSVADRVKQIKTDARINHVQTDKLIAALIAEKEMLLRELEAVNRSGTPTEGFTNDGDWIFFSKYRVLPVKRCLISWEFFFVHTFFIHKYTFMWLC